MFGGKHHGFQGILHSFLKFFEDVKTRTDWPVPPCFTLFHPVSPLLKPGQVFFIAVFQDGKCTFKKLMQQNIIIYQQNKIHLTNKTYHKTTNFDIKMDQPNAQFVVKGTRFHGCPQRGAGLEAINIAGSLEKFMKKRHILWIYFHEQISNWTIFVNLLTLRFHDYFCWKVIEHLPIVGCMLLKDHARFMLKNDRKKNKMKPTNPNADTYVEKQRFNTCLSQFPANPLVEHPDLTHWGDTLVGHPCLTPLRYTLVRHSCLTLLLDTLVRHFLLDTLTCHSCKTLLLNTLVRHFLLDTSYLALLTWHSSGTLLLDTFVKHSCLTDALLRHSYMALLYDTLTWHSSGTLLLDTLVRHSDLTLLYDALTWHSCETLWLDTLVRHSWGTLLLDTLVGHSDLTLL